MCGTITNLKSNSSKSRRKIITLGAYLKDVKQGIPHPMHCPIAQQKLQKNNQSMVYYNESRSDGEQENKFTQYYENS
jgi:hypothetical protein